MSFKVFTFSLRICIFALIFSLLLVIHPNPCKFTHFSSPGLISLQDRFFYSSLNHFSYLWVAHMEAAEDDCNPELMSRLVHLVKEISGLAECRNVCKKMHGNLIRRIKLLSPLFEELKDDSEALNGEDVKGFESMKAALNSALELLKSILEGSKMYQALQWQKTADKFHQITGRIEAALDEIPYDKLAISEEV